MLEQATRLINKGFTTAYATAMLGGMGAAFGILPRIRKQLKNPDGTNYCARLAFQTFDGQAAVSAIFDNGWMSVRPYAVENPDVTIRFTSQEIMRDILSPNPKGDIFNLLLSGDVVYEGNLSHLARFSFLTSELATHPSNGNKGKYFEPVTRIGQKRFSPRPMKPHMGVQFLQDPAFANKDITDFPAIEALWKKHFTTKPEICSERARLFTEFFMQNGFEKDSTGQNWDPNLRQGKAIEYALSNKRLVIHDDDLLLGTTSCKEVGVLVFPEFGGIAIWPELNTMNSRELNPYTIDERHWNILNNEVFPFWIDRNIREHCRKKNGNPLCQQLEERWVLYFMWKVHALSHTVPDFPRVLQKGLLALRDEAQKRADKEKDEKKKRFHQAVAGSFNGVMAYAGRMADHALEVANSLDPVKDKKRIAALKAMAKRIRHAPAKPARSLAEAVNAVWLVWLSLHQENMNAGLSLGRLDLWLQPYLEMDMKRAKTEKGRQRVAHRAIELCCAFLLKCQDHLPLIPDIGNRLFGGSSSDQALTLGGVDEKGKSAVSDMTYIWLKATEMLGLRDPNVNARYHKGKNPKEYLRRLVEVNAITGATPSIHNDQAVIATMEHGGFSKAHARNWSATGCVEPTSSGRHCGNTGGMMLNLVAPLETTLHNGVHPLIRGKIGEGVGDLTKGDGPATFDVFLETYKTNLKSMIDQSIDYNNQLGLAHRKMHPTPLLSGLIQGTAKAGKDITEGGAMYNTSGAAMVALVDVVDSLMAVKKLVYEKSSVSWEELMAAINSDFAGYDKLHAILQNKVPKFGGADPEPAKLAQELIDFIYDCYISRDNYRGGKCSCGFWSMSNHVAFGVLSGALPSGRKKGKAFTPGITPAPEASDNILDPIRTVAALDPLKMPNNIAFNVKLFPMPDEPGEKFVDHVTDLTEGYTNLGGMQMQFNIVTSETLRDAMKNPAAYRNLLVRISGYNAYFVELNKDMQIELVERADYRAK